MRQKPWIIALLLFIFFSYLGYSSLVHAQINQTPTPTAEPTVEDAVYADLALRNYLDNVSVEYNDNNPGTNFSLDGDKHWYPASTIKLFVAMYAYDQVDKGNLNLTDTVTANSTNVVTTELETDQFPPIQEGSVVTIDTLIRQMITQSDNTAFNMLLDVLDRQKITDYIHSLGLVNTSVGSKLNQDTTQEQTEYDIPGYGINTTTADDYTTAFLLIENHKVPYADQLFDILRQQKINNMIPEFLPKDVIVAHKTGDLAPIYHDGGIIESKDKKYVLSVFSNTNDPNVIAHLSQLIYTKNFDLVGAPVQPPSTQAISYPVDPLVMNPKPVPSNVLAAETQANLQITPLTASDLGITAKDLALSLTPQQLPKVYIDPSSPWHVLIPASQLIAKVFVVGGSEARARVDLTYIPQQLADAKYLQEHGKTSQATTILQQVQPQLQQLVQNKELLMDTTAQTQIQSLSETRFNLLGEQLQASDINTKKQIIKEIAQQAKATVMAINPNIPKAINATNPNQSVLTGTVVSSTPTTVTVKTSAGTITMPLDNVKIRSAQQIVAGAAPSPTPITPTLVAGTGTPSLSTTPVPTPTGEQTQLQPGTTVALAGSIDNEGFGATFILTHVPTELIAPQPVAVLKVNPQSNTMVVEQNGIPFQVNVSPQTNIRGSSTTIPLSAIKPGDIVVVHGNPVAQSVPTAPSVPSPTGVLPTNTQTPQKAGPTAIPGTPVPTVKPGQPTYTPAPQPTGKTGTTNPTYSAPTTANGKQITSKTQTPTAPSTPTAPAPKVIQSTSIQVVEQKKDTTQTAPKPGQQTQPQQQPKAQQQNQPQKQSQPQQPAAPAKSSSENKNKK